MKKRVIIFLLLAGIGLINNLISQASFAIGYPIGKVIHSGVYIEYALFVIWAVFALEVCISVIKGIFIRGSVVLGIITGLIMILYAIGYNRENLLVAMYFICVALLSFIVSLHIMFEIRPKTEEEMRLLAGIMSGLTYKKKFKVAFLLVCVCIACVIYIIIPKNWVCLYVDSHQFLEHSYKVNNDVLVAGDEVAIVNNLILNDMKYEAGWKFHANKSGNAKVTISSVVQYDHNEFYHNTWEIYVDDDLYVHYDADFEYYLNVYNFFIFLIVISLVLSIIFVVSGIRDKTMACKEGN